MAIANGMEVIQGNNPKRLKAINERYILARVKKFQERFNKIHREKRQAMAKNMPNINIESNRIKITPLKLTGWLSPSSSRYSSGM